MKYAWFLSAFVLLSACPRPLGAPADAQLKTFQFDAAPKNDGPVLAQVGDTALTVNQIQKLINKQSPYVRAQYAKDPAALDKFIQGQIRYALLAEKGIALGYNKDPEVMDAAKKLIVQKLTRDVFDNRVKLADVTDSEVEAFYAANVGDYKKPAHIRLAHIFFKFGEEKEEALARAKALLPEVQAPDQLASRSHFRNLVQKHSEDEDTKSIGGDLRYRSKEELASVFGDDAAKKAWSLTDINSVSGVVESKTGFHIFKKLGARDPTNRELSEVRAQVKNRVYRKKRKASFEAYIDQIEQEIGVTLHEAQTKSLRFDVGPQQDPHAHLPGHGAH